MLFRSEAIGKTPMSHRASSQVIYCMLDEAIYMAKTAEGGWTPLKPPKKQIQHVEGELTVAPRERIKEICSLLNPLFAAASSMAAIVLMPLPRWPDSPCCNRAGHCVGYTDSTAHLGGLVSKLELVRRGIKQHMRLMKFSGVRVASLAKTILGSGGPWSSPTIPNMGAYQALLAKALEELNSRAIESETAISQDRGREREAGPSRKRPHSTSGTRHHPQSNNTMQGSYGTGFDSERHARSGREHSGRRGRGGHMGRKPNKFRGSFWS